MEDGRRIATVTQINNYIKAVLDKVPVLQNIWINPSVSMMAVQKDFITA